MNGWIKLYRQIQDCWIWGEKEPFDKRSAWIDLLLLANHKDKKIAFNGEIITVKRGQYLTSVRKLSERWKWSVNKVYRFMKLLESDGMLKKESDRDRTLLTIENYSNFQDGEYTNGNSSEYTNGYSYRNTNEYTNGNTIGNSYGNTEDTPTNTPAETVTEHKQEYKNDKNVKKEEEREEQEEGKNGRREEDVIFTDSNESVCRTDVQRVADAWNELQNYGIAPVSRIASKSKRYQSLVARIRQYGEDDVLDAIDKIKMSDFLQGRNNKGWVITFDWFVLPNNFLKVLEGNYDNRNTQSAYREDINKNQKSQLAYLLKSIEEDEENERKGG